MVEYILTLVNFLTEHFQQHVVIGSELLMNPRSLKQGAEYLQQLQEKRTYF